MAGVVLMAKKQAKSKAAAVEGTTRAMRMSKQYADWLESLAAHDRSTIAALFDRALTHYAKHIGFTEAPPERI